MNIGILILRTRTSWRVKSRTKIKINLRGETGVCSFLPSVLWQQQYTSICEANITECNQNLSKLNVLILYVYYHAPFRSYRQLMSHPYTGSIKWGRSCNWEHGRSQGEQKNLISFCNFHNS